MSTWLLGSMCHWNYFVTGSRAAHWWEVAPNETNTSCSTPSQRKVSSALTRSTASRRPSNQWVTVLRKQACWEHGQQHCILFCSFHWYTSSFLLGWSWAFFFFTGKFCLKLFSKKKKKGWGGAVNLNQQSVFRHRFFSLPPSPRHFGARQRHIEAGK